MLSHATVPMYYDLVNVHFICLAHTMTCLLEQARDKWLKNDNHVEN